MADVLLASEDPNVRFFGALTFTVKINCNWCVRCCFGTGICCLIKRTVGIP